MPKLTNPSADTVRLVSGRDIAAGETVDVTDEEYATAGPLFLREEAVEDAAPKRKAVKRSAHGAVETSAVEGIETR